jgi:hypothetical protein
MPLILLAGVQYRMTVGGLRSVVILALAVSMTLSGALGLLNGPPASPVAQVVLFFGVPIVVVSVAVAAFRLGQHDAQPSRV